MAPKSQEQLVIHEYLSEWNDLPNLTLAKKIYAENNVMFKSVESVRSRIRYLRHQRGKLLRERISKEHSKFKTKPGEMAIKNQIPNPYYLPESEESDWEVFQVPKGNNRVLILSDVHIPYHNVKALTSCLDLAKKEKVNAVYLNGDIMDAYQLSRFVKDPRKRSFAQELEDTRNFLGVLQDHLQCPIYYKLGNHEDRYEAFLKVKAPELLDVSEYKLANLLRFGQYGVQLIESKQLAKIGKLSVLHGHEFGRSVFSPVNPARGYYNRAKKSMIAGHNHQTSEHSEKSLDGEVVTVWSTGCLCELRPDYMPFNKWNHGAAIVYVEKSGNYDVHNFRIIDGKIY
jgi:predicted phosphodiesterase